MSVSAERFCECCGCLLPSSDEFSFTSFLNHVMFPIEVRKRLKEVIFDDFTAYLKKREITLTGNRKSGEKETFLYRNIIVSHQHVKWATTNQKKRVKDVGNAQPIAGHTRRVQ